MAEREGFEPTIPVKVYTLSKRAPSATRPSLRTHRIRSIHYNGTEERTGAPQTHAGKKYGSGSFLIWWKRGKATYRVLGSSAGARHALAPKFGKTRSPNPKIRSHLEATLARIAFPPV